MQLNTNVNKWILLTLIMSSLAYLLFISHSLSLRGYDDDKIFLSIFNSDNMMEILAARYNQWSGRFMLEWLMTSTIGYTWLWKVGVPVSIMLSCYSACRIAGQKANIIGCSIALLLFASIPYDINSDASWWITGFYNYLLPISVALYTFSVAISDSNSIFEKISCLVLAFYFPYMEQAGVAFIIAMLALLAFKKESRNKINYALIVIAVINLIICLKAPGNERRFSEEVWNWYPEYQTYGLSIKLALGFDKLHQLMTMRANFPLIVLSLAIIYFRSVSGNMGITIKMAMFIVITFVAISIAKALTGIPAGGFFFNSVPVNATIWSAGKLFLSYLYLFSVISSMFIIMLDMALKKYIGATPIMAMLIGYMTVTMMGLTPTVYASGLRVDMVFEMMCIVAVMKICTGLLSPRHQIAG
ncbi:hypothetical protein [Chimaeribacter arupi]|uniref:hypothetical protein n=1 Tax=Chimaeribacter arupi TaxID=2060066 RepID=UPI000C7A15B6|nr:hypothetical protein [Chimaeribacter arupi]PLR52428.1 hypothetical protein CYR52_07675 [Chimaeribacter arupi]